MVGYNKLEDINYDAELEVMINSGLLDDEDEEEDTCPECGYPYSECEC